MNNDILKKLTFGFEIEGYFKKDIDKEITHGNFVYDSSVSGMSPAFEVQRIKDPREFCIGCLSAVSGSYCQVHHAVYRHENDPATEFSSLVFESFSQCVKTLGMFQESNHIYNHSCGLHVHVGIKGDKNKLFSIVSNLDYLKSLKEYALTWCEHQKTRLQRTSNFYEDYQSSRDIIGNTNGTLNNKYKMVRFHRTYNTLEFRFLCPCEHKVNNVIHLLNHLTTYMGRNESIHRTSEIEEVTKPYKIDIVKRLTTRVEALYALRPGPENAYRRAMTVEGNLYQPRYAYYADSRGKTISNEKRNFTSFDPAMRATDEIINLGYARSRSDGLIGPNSI